MKLKILKNKTLKNAGWIVFGRIANMLISFFVGILTARYLGPSNYGLIGYAASYTAFFMAFCTLGINSILVKEFVERPEKEGETLGTTLVLRLISSIMSVGIIMCIVFFVDGDEPITMAVVALCSIGAIFHIFEIFNYWFQAHLRSKVTAIASLTAYAVMAGYKILLLVFGKSVTWFAFATSVDYICIAVLLLIAYFRHKGKRLSFSWDTAKRLLKQSYPFILSGLMVSIYAQTDKFMLKQFMDESEVGFYTVASTISTMWCFVLSAIIDSVYPSIMKANGTDEELFKRRNKQLYAIVFYVSISVSVGFMLLAPFVIRILYGAAYAPAVPVLRIATWYTAFSYLGVARNAWIVCKGRQKYLTFIYIGSAVANVALNLLLIPGFGANGAAVASLISQVLVAIILPFFIKGLRENSVMMLESLLFIGVKQKKQKHENNSD